MSDMPILLQHNHERFSETGWKRFNQSIQAHKLDTINTVIV